MAVICSVVRNDALFALLLRFLLTFTSHDANLEVDATKLREMLSVVLE